MTKSSWSLRQMVGGLLGNRRDDASDSFSDETADADVKPSDAATPDRTFARGMDADDFSASIVTPRSAAPSASAEHDETNFVSESPAADYSTADELFELRAVRPSFDRDRALADDDRTIEITAPEAATAEGDEAAYSNRDAFAPRGEGYPSGSELTGSTQASPTIPDQGGRFVENPVFDPGMDSRSDFTGEQPPISTTTDAEAASTALVGGDSGVMTGADLLTGAPATGAAVSTNGADDNLLLDLEDFSSAPVASGTATPAFAYESDDGLLDLDDESSTASRSPAPDVVNSDSFVVGADDTAAASPADRQVVTTPLIAPPVGVKALAPDQSAPVPVGTEHLSPEVVDRIARRVVELMSERLVREIAWEVVPELAERMIRRRLETDESGL